MQALELIRELQKKYPITRACMKLRFVVPDNQIDRLTTTLNTWNARIETKEKMTAVTTLVFPRLFGCAGCSTCWDHCDVP